MLWAVHWALHCGGLNLSQVSGGTWQGLQMVWVGVRWQCYGCNVTSTVHITHLEGPKFNLSCTSWPQRHVCTCSPPVRTKLVYIAPFRDRKSEFGTILSPSHVLVKNSLQQKCTQHNTNTYCKISICNPKVWSQQYKHGLGKMLARCFLGYVGTSFWPINPGGEIKGSSL